MIILQAPRKMAAVLLSSWSSSMSRACSPMKHPTWASKPSRCSSRASRCCAGACFAFRYTLELKRALASSSASQTLTRLASTSCSADVHPNLRQQLAGQQTCSLVITVHACELMSVE